MPKLQKGKAAVLNKHELNRLLKVVSSGKHGKRDYLMVLMSFGTGMRVMEIAALKLYNVITEDDKVIEEVSLRITKGNKQRNIYLVDKKIQTALIDYVKERRETAIRTKRVYSIEQPLFLSQKGSCFSNKTMQKLFESFYKAAGISGASSHSGRRTFITNLIEQGADIKSVSILAGHAYINQTADYVQDNPVRLKRLSALALF